MCVEIDHSSHKHNTDDYFETLVTDAEKISRAAMMQNQKRGLHPTRN